MVLELIGSIAAPGEQNNSSGPTTMTATDKKHFLTNPIIGASLIKQNEASVGILGNIWLHRLLMRSSEALSPLPMGVLKRGVAAEVPCGVQLQDGSESLSGGGGAKELGPRLCIWGMTGADVEVGAGVE